MLDFQGCWFNTRFIWFTCILTIKIVCHEILVLLEVCSCQLLFVVIDSFQYYKDIFMYHIFLKIFLSFDFKILPHVTLFCKDYILERISQLFSLHYIVHAESKTRVIYKKL